MNSAHSLLKEGIPFGGGTLPIFKRSAGGFYF
jgi:hypothetical protein